MRERDFIRQNRSKWEEFEKLFGNARSEPRRLTELYVQITEDLSYARTFYPNRSVRAYLNTLSQRVFQRIYRNRRNTAHDFQNFWAFQLPGEFWSARIDLLISLLVFLGAVAIGLLSSVHNTDFATLILGQDYVDMTRQNIANGDPMLVYKDSPPGIMFLRIFSNNLFVDAITFTMGIIYAIGTLFIMLYNGIMVGTFQYFFVEYGLLGESALAIWQHGTLEMSAMVIAGAAGLTMGRGIAFPGTYTRLQAFRLSAVRGFRMMVLVFFMTLIAALIESWVTRHTEIPDSIRVMVIAVSLFLVLGYVVWYPMQLARSGLLEKFQIRTLPARNLDPIQLDQTRSAGDLFTLAFRHYQSLARPLISRILLGSLLLAALFTYARSWIPMHDLVLDVPLTASGPMAFIGSIGEYLQLTLQFGDYRAAPWLAPVNLAGYFLVFTTVIRLFGQYAGWPPAIERRDHGNWRRNLSVLGALSFGQLLLFLPQPEARLVFILFFPLVALWACIAWWEGATLTDGLARAIQLIRVDWMNCLGAYLGTGLVCLVSLFIVNSPLFGFYTQFLQANLPPDSLLASRLPAALIVFQAYAAFFLVLPLLFGTMAGYYFHARELDEGNGLRNRIQNLCHSQNRGQR